MFEHSGRTDGRQRLTPEHGYTISSPCEPDSSGELKSSNEPFDEKDVICICEKQRHRLAALLFFTAYKVSLVMRKPAFCICENKDADQVHGNREADQRLCFRYKASTILLLPKYKISSL